MIQEWLKQIGLELRPEKTKIAHTLGEYGRNKPGFDFLGFTIRQGQVKSTELGFKTLIKPSSQEYQNSLSETGGYMIFPQKRPNKGSNS